MNAQTLSDAPGSRWSQFYALTKPRVVQLIVFCALIGMVLAVPGVPTLTQLGDMAIACFGIWLVSAAAAAFNCLVERHIDARMKRTSWRPTAKGELTPAGTGLLGHSVHRGCSHFAGLHQPADHVADAGNLYWLRRDLHRHPQACDPQDIVIGGASGAMPPVLGWAAMTGQVSAEAWVLFLIIFLWTPPHFWALALYRVEDYKKSGLPMLPVTHGPKYTQMQILLYTLVLFAGCLLPVIFGMSGWLYLIVASVLCLGFSWYALRLWMNYSDALARKTFRFSLIHLSGVFAALLIDHYIVS